MTYRSKLPPLAVTEGRGKKFLELQVAVMERLCKAYNLKQIKTNHNNTSVDGFLGTADGKGVCVFEYKSRSKTFDYFKKWGLFISESKIEKGKKYSALFGVPFVLYFYLFEVDEMYSLMLTDDKGNTILDLPEAVEKNTQYDTNNNMRKNDMVVYLPVDKLKKLKL